MFDDIFSPDLSFLDLFGGDDPFEPVSDYLSGYTSANSANRFYAENMALQQAYNERNMQLQDDYNVKNMARTDSYQRALMSDSPSLQVAALRRAGLNPLLAVGNGITSANTAVHSSNPTSAAPSAAMPRVDSNLGSALSLATSALSGVSDFMRLANETKVADAQVRNLAADSALKSAQTITQPSIKSKTDAQTTREQVNTITDVVGSSIPLATSAAGAYAAKKSADVAIEGIKHGLTKESATKMAKDIVGKSPASSAYSAAGVLGVLGSRLLPAASIGLGISNDIKTKKRMSAKDFKNWSNIRASSYGY